MAKCQWGFEQNVCLPFPNGDCEPGYVINTEKLSCTLLTNDVFY